MSYRLTPNLSSWLVLRQLEQPDCSFDFKYEFLDQIYRVFDISQAKFKQNDPKMAELAISVPFRAAGL